MIGIIGAMSVEVKSLISLLSDKTVERISGVDYYRGKLTGKEVVVAKCGIGKVFAAMCCQTMILKYQPELIINTGIAGGLVSSLAVNDLVIADSLVQHDFDTSALGDVGGLIIGTGRVYIPCAKKLVKAFAQAADRLNFSYRIGRIASGDQFIADVKRAQKIVKQFKALACEMEGAALAQICYVNKVDFIVIRCISDITDGKSHLNLVFTTKKAAQQSLKLLAEFIAHYE